MADSQDAIELKRRARRRLVGAIALVVFVVIALPIVLDREPKPISQDLSIQIPSQDASKFSSRVLPAEPPSPPTIAPEVKAVAEAPKLEAPKLEAPKAEAPKAEAKAAEAKVAELKPAASAGKAEAPAPKAAIPEPKAEAKAAPMQKPAASAAVASAKDAVKAEAAKAPASAPAEIKSAATESFFVPLGMFSKADNIKQVRSKAGSAGFKTFTEAVAGTDRVRVRAGPFASRDAAEKARDKLKGAGLDVGAVAVK